MTTKIDVSELLNRATAGQNAAGKHFSPSLFYRLMNDPFGLWCDYNAQNDEAVDEPDRYGELRMRRGVEFERQWIESQYPYAIHVEPQFGLAALKRSLELMANGEEAIAAPQLWWLGEDVKGRGDLIVRDNSKPSDLGAYHYKVKEVKIASQLQDYHSLQAALYNRILGKIQGYTPRAADVILNGKKAIIKVQDYESRIDEQLNLWRNLRDNKVQPEPAKPDATGSPWRIYANKLLEKRRDLTLIADVGQATRDKLRKKLGVQKIEDLFPLNAPDLRKALNDGAADNLFWHAQAFKEQKPVLPPGKKLKLRRATRLYDLDFETSDTVHPTEPPHVYLIGLYDRQKAKFVHFLGKGHKDEERIFQELLDYIGDPQDAVLYHWTDFEIGQMKEVQRRYPGLTERTESLLASCVDMKEAVKGTVYFPVSTYSIKKVAPFLGFKWRRKEVNAFESMCLYWDWLKSGEPDTIQRVLDYNEDDCQAMYFIDMALAIK